MDLPLHFIQVIRVDCYQAMIVVHSLHFTDRPILIILTPKHHK